MSKIPDLATALIRVRDRDRCQRCGGGASDRHHRQRRRDGGHGAGNLVLMCRTCHGWVHGNPIKAQETGFIVKFADNYLTVPIKTYAGWALLHDDGTMSPSTSA